MVEKVARYAILSFFSFLFFTFVFHAAASTSPIVASGTASPSIFPSVTPTESIPSPTPTIFLYVTPTATPSSTLTPTPTMISPSMHPLMNRIQSISPTPTPTIQPTATPIPTEMPTEIPSPSPTLMVTLTPTLQPTITAVTTVGSTDLETLFTAYSNTYHVDKNLLEKIARCESGFNSNALNGDYTGMFQFASSSWISVRTTMGLDTNPDLRKNAEESIRTAAYMLSQGHASAWPSCSR